MLFTNAHKAIGIGVGIGAVCVVVAISWWYFARPVQNPTVLSERSQQFMAEHGKDIATQEVSFDDQKEYQQDTAYDQHCYSFEMPFKSIAARMEDPADSCITRLMTKEPISRVAIQAKTAQNALAEDPAITMRRANSNQYHETVLLTKKFGEVLRFNGEDAVTLFWQTAGKTITIGFTGLTDPATVDDSRLIKLIESFQLVTAPAAIRTYEATSSTPSATDSAF